MRLADLEALLRPRALDRTLTSVAPIDPQAVVPTGLAELDDRLGGGLPRGQLSEIVGPRSSGRTSLAVAVLASATLRGELAALVDPLDRFDPNAAWEAGADLARLLWVRGPARVDPAVRGDQRRLALDRGLKALNLILQSGGFGVAALDLADLGAVTLGRVPFTTWLRLQRVIEGSPTACLLLGSEPIARSSSGLTIATRPGARAGRWRGAGGRARLFDGLDVAVRVARARFRTADDRDLMLTAGA